MNRRTVLISVAGAGALAVFGAATLLYQQRETKQSGQLAAANQGVMVREHSPVVGPAQAPVTIVEFIDPACEACRAFYPFVKQTMAAYPREVRLVIRYVPFHGEPSVVGVQILEAARKQGRFESVLEALLRDQPVWADHHAPAPGKAWDIAVAAGLDVQQAKAFLASGTVDRVLQQDVEDLQAVGVKATPTFFVNGKPLAQVDPRTLHDMVKAAVEGQK